MVPAYAQNYAVACLHNATGQRINLTWRWGNRDWSAPKYLASDEYYILAWEDNGYAPKLDLRMDADMTDGTDWRVFHLDTYATYSKNCREGKNFTIRNRNGYLVVRTND
jgi:hypothetical protein